MGESFSRSWIEILTMNPWKSHEDSSTCFLDCHLQVMSPWGATYDDQA